MKIQQLGSKSNILTMTGKVCLWNIRWNSFQKTLWKNIQKTILYREMLMKISVQNPILPTVILHLVFSVWVAHVRNLLPWVLPSCWKENHQEIYSEYWWRDSGTEARCVGSYMIMPVELIDIFLTENLEILKISTKFYLELLHHSTYKYFLWGREVL